ncbi:MAG: helix-turn-helix domain-containing protein [Bacteroidetes bacterium]|nr:helix-turn-helix domain-containing protein [Bacteroidota bacterium]
MSLHDIIEIKNKLEKDSNFKISRFKEVIKRTSPHKHENYYELIYLSEGAGFHWIDEQKFQINPPEVYIVRGGQLHYWQLTEIPKGYVILFKECFFDYVNQAEMYTLVRRLESTNHIKLNGDPAFHFLFSEIEKEYLSTASASTIITHGYMKALLGKIMQYEKPDNQTLQHQEKYLAFLQLLQTSNLHFRRVKEYAGKLCTTPQNLNAVCRKTCNKSAGEIIHEQLILEAKRLLLHTDKTVKEIAGELNFTDDSNFVKFFKSSCKVSPHQFKERYFH